MFSSGLKQMKEVLALAQEMDIKPTLAKLGQRMAVRALALNVAFFANQLLPFD